MALICPTSRRVSSSTTTELAAAELQTPHPAAVAAVAAELLPPPLTHPPAASGTMAGEAVGKRGEAPRAGDGAVWEVEAGTLDEMPVLGNWEDTAEGAAATRGVAVAVTLALGKFVTATGEVTRSVVVGKICMRTLAATGEVTRSVRNCSSRASQTARARSRSASAAAAICCGERAAGAGAGAGAGGDA
jgi:hypothetical protein